jgi:hypothetical protein
MAISSAKLLNGDGFWLERDGATYRDPMKMVAIVPGGGRVVSPDLTNHEVRYLASLFATVLFERTGKVIWPHGSSASMLHAYDKFAMDEKSKWEERAAAFEQIEVDTLADEFDPLADEEDDPLAL